MAEFEFRPDDREYSPRLKKLPAPQAGIFDYPSVSLCLNEKWGAFIHGLLSVLESGQYWIGDQTEIERIEQEIYKLGVALGGIGNPCGGGFPTEGEICNSYAPNSNIIAYAPNDPFQTPNYTPSGYHSPPWASYDNLLSQLAGGQSGDAIFSVLAVKPDATTLGFPFAWMLQNVIQAIGFLSSGFPRFEVKMTGTGKATIKLLAIPFGGQAYVSVDNQLTQIVDTFTVTPASATELNDWIELILGSLATDDSLIEERIIELDFVGSGTHQIDITFVPMLGVDGNIGWGGGLREVELCNEQLLGVSNQMPQFRVNQETLNVEWKPTELHTEFEPLGQVIYPVHMQTEIDQITQTPKIQWTLQPIPIGGGASPFDSWLDLTEILSGEDAETPQFRVDSGWVQWKLPSESEWTNLFEIPQDGQDGQDGTTITQVIVNTLAAGSSATADLVGTVLTLGIPQGANGIDGIDGTNITQVIANTLAAGSSATANLAGTVLTLGIPRGNQGLDAECDPCGQGSGSVDPVGSEAAQSICGGVTVLVDWWLAKWGDYYNELSQTSQNVGTAADIFLNLFGLSTVASAFGAAQSVYDAGLSTVNTWVTDSDTRDQIICYLYQETVNNGDQFTTGVWGAVVGILKNEILNPASVAFGNFIDGLGYAQAEFRYRVGTYSPSVDCALLCGGSGSEWCYQFDFADGQFDWTIRQGYQGLTAGGYTAEVGFQTTQYITNNYSIFVARPFAASVKQIMLTFSGTGSFQFTLWNSNTWLLAEERNSSNEIEGVSGVLYNLDWTVTDGLYIVIWSQSGGTVATLENVRLYGDGLNPFGSSNCI